VYSRFYPLDMPLSPLNTTTLSVPVMNKIEDTQKVMENTAVAVNICYNTSTSTMPGLDLLHLINEYREKMKRETSLSVNVKCYGTMGDRAIGNIEKLVTTLVDNNADSVNLLMEVRERHRERFHPSHIKCRR
jgi:hypothetical protein